MKLSNELTQQVKAHLDNVRKYLGALPADERQEILQSIESHIYDALQSRSDGDPTPALLEAVIAELDPPDSYGELNQAQPRKTKRWSRLLIPGLILLTLIATAIWPRSEKTRDPVGRWESVDFVASIEQFDPATKKWRGDLALKELTFLPDGKTDKLFWTWENDILHHSGDNTDAKFVIKKISGKECLFLEWISGDVIHGRLPPKYYVLKKSDRN